MQADAKRPVLNKGSQVQILSARPQSPGEPQKYAELRGFFYARNQGSGEASPHSVHMAQTLAVTRRE